MSFKFGPGTIIVHVRTQKVYRIVGTPNKVIYEPTGEPCYTYQSSVMTDRRVWVRPQSQMEDGRFVLQEEQS